MVSIINSKNIRLVWMCVFRDVVVLNNAITIVFRLSCSKRSYCNTTAASLILHHRKWNEESCRRTEREVWRGDHLLDDRAIQGKKQILHTKTSGTDSRMLLAKGKATFDKREVMHESQLCWARREKGQWACAMRTLHVRNSFKKFSWNYNHFKFD